MKKTKLLLAFCLAGCMAKAQIISTVAGNGTQGYSGDGGFAVNAELDAGALAGFVTLYTELYKDGSGNIYFSDGANNRVRKISATGIISTIIGNGTAGYTGDGSAASSAEINTPAGIVTDVSGNIYISDMNNQVIRKINTAGTISTFAGNGTAGFSGDGGAATAAKLDYPLGLAIDGSGNLYVTDWGNGRIRKINTSGNISTYAGGGSILGDGGAATNALLSYPAGIAFDASGNLYIGGGSQRVRIVNTSGTINTFAGNGMTGYTGDGGAATSAKLSSPFAISFDPSGNLYIADLGNNVIRKVNTAGTISTFAGNGTSGYTGDGGSPTSAELSQPDGIYADANGNIYVVDGDGRIIREISSLCPANGGPNGTATNAGACCAEQPANIGTPAVTNMSYSWLPTTDFK